jgi:hypothetical protein
MIALFQSYIYMCVCVCVCVYAGVALLPQLVTDIYIEIKQVNKLCQI